MAAPVQPSPIPEIPVEETENQLSRQSISVTKLLRYDGNQEFKTFKQKRDVDSTLTVYFFIFQVILSVGRCLVFLRDTESPLPLRVIILLRFLIVLFLGGAYVYLTRKIANSTIFDQSDGTKLLRIGNALVMALGLLEGTMMLTWAFTIGDCEVFWCKADKNIIPLTRILYLVGGGFANPIFYGCHSSKTSLTSSFYIYICVFVVAIQRKLLNVEVFSVAVMGIIMFYTIAKYETEVLSNFISYSKFESALRVQVASENKEYLMRTQTEEMRHMIGNVAHDLRTPLQAFQSEIELLQNNIMNDDNTPEKQKFQLDSIKQLGLICHFMNMTINRSIDFTKASSGIKLNPSIESINFSDTMSWAVGCMVTTQGTVPIVLEPIPSAIHDYIYTDKQWLMENMLCLLSNAQKFTTEGAITIRCSLHSKFEGGVVQRSSSADDTSIASVSSRVSVSSAKKYSIREHYGDKGDVHTGRSRGELSSWRERVSDFVVDLECGSVSLSDETPTSSEGSSRMLMIMVEDSGIGITKENRDKLFQPFMQAQHRTGGTGLGLYSLSKRLESLGGNCGVEGRSDGASGSCFWISIPYRPDRSVSQPPKNCRFVRATSTVGVRSSRGVGRNDSDQLVSITSGYISHDGDSADEQSVREQTGSRLHGLRILLVDDSALIRKTMSRSLVNEGYLVEVARQGAECLKMLEASRATCKSGGYGFDVVLMDLQMPVMDGLEATRRIRELEKAEAEAAVTEGGGGSGGGRVGSGGGSTASRHITIIGVSAHTESEARAECADCGMDSFIEKPLQMKHLRRCLLSMGVRSRVDVKGFKKCIDTVNDDEEMVIKPME